ncbi:MAG: rhodanese-related sulfurtransferase [Nevskiales bacterium]
MPPENQPSIVVAALYHFARLPDFRDFSAPLTELGNKHGITGTILLAAEGVNGTIAGSREGIDAMLAFLRADERLQGLEHKESFTDAMPFYRMKVKLKKEIVTMGVPDTDPAKIVGTYLDAEQWNALIEDPDVLVIDTRNDYEIGVGKFKNAISPHTKTFREFPDYVARELADKKDKKIAMYCTGGIRCEKSTSYLKSQGFEEVFHLKGGILKYLETVKPEDNLWEGECFVFDHRVAVDKNLEPGEYEQCHACRRPITRQEMQSPDYVEGVSCPHCINEYSDERRARFAERQRQIKLARARGEEHLGKQLSNKADPHDD